MLHTVCNYTSYACIYARNHGNLKLFPQQSHMHLAKSSLDRGKPRCHGDRGCGVGSSDTGGGWRDEKGSYEDTHEGGNTRGTCCTCVSVWGETQRGRVNHLNKNVPKCTTTRYKQSLCVMNKETLPFREEGDWKSKEEASFFFFFYLMWARVDWAQGPRSWAGPAFFHGTCVWLLLSLHYLFVLQSMIYLIHSNFTDRVINIRKEEEGGGRMVHCAKAKNCSKNSLVLKFLTTNQVRSIQSNFSLAAHWFSPALLLRPSNSESDS